MQTKKVQIGQYLSWNEGPNRIRCWNPPQLERYVARNDLYSRWEWVPAPTWWSGGLCQRPGFVKIYLYPWKRSEIKRSYNKAASDLLGSAVYRHAYIVLTDPFDAPALPLNFKDENVSEITELRNAIRDNMALGLLEIDYDSCWLVQIDGKKEPSELLLKAIELGPIGDG
jgi:hypothetical protein